ncbi:UNVERIFIED_CONTAM: hypothetical protein Slati_3845500 [Sesamum latifolium]|uniref:CCHC-type domain-containing protein n=1 Tax=Sesamum latifolium TaxID=2727402 RepID=A0AAW2TNU4_9LAMI
MGRLLSSKQPKFEALVMSVRSMLNPVKGLEMRRFEGDRFLIRFNHVIDRNTALEGCPWSFKKNTLILSGVGVNENPMHVDLNWCEFFVHVHNLTLSKMTMEIAALIGDELVVSFTYERLQNYCYLCGKLGHISKYCVERFAEDFVYSGKDMPFGPWLRASPRDWGPNFSQNSAGTSSPNTGHRTMPRGGVGSFEGPLQTDHSREAPIEHARTRRPIIEEQGAVGNRPTYSPPLQQNKDASPHPLVTATPAMNQPQIEGPESGAEGDMIMDEGLVNIPILFTSTAGKGDVNRCRRDQRRMASGGSASRKHIRSVPVIELELGSPWTVRVLRDHIRLHNPALVFLSQTKCKRRKCENLKEKFNLFGINVDSYGKAGGLMLLWRKDINLVVKSYSYSHIDAVLSKEDGTEGWRFTGVYGDFNEILSQDEKTGAPRPRPSTITGGQKRRLFKLETMWTRDTGCEETIRRAWSSLGSGTTGDCLIQNIHKVRQELSSSEKSNFGSVMGQIKALEEELQTLTEDPPSTVIHSRRAALREQLDVHLPREEIMWKQRGKAQWLQEGDMNTTFFHARVSSRLQKNAITRLKLGNGSWSNSSEEVQQAITDYF